MCFISCAFFLFVLSSFQEAIKEYTACLLLVPNNNLSMKRDVLEGMARCYSHLGNNRQALEICEKLVGYSISCLSDKAIFYRYYENI